ncbi:hypothetical protein NX059_004328 [Plenodomus lindquistii]|nr:hypothetical protein NX059_004328 [Plenodomus lindquistii]
MKASIILALAGTSVAAPFGGFFESLFGLGGSPKDSTPSGIPSGIFPPSDKAPYPTGTGFGTGLPQGTGLPDLQLLNARGGPHHPHPTGGFPGHRGPGKYPVPTGFPAGLAARDNAPYPYTSVSSTATTIWATGAASLAARDDASSPTISGAATAAAVVARGTGSPRPHGRPHKRPHHRPSGDVKGFARPTGKPFPYGGAKPTGFATRTRGSKPSRTGGPWSE